MELIKKLDKKFINNKWIYLGIFLCPYCLQEVIKILYHGKRDKSCGCKRYELMVEKNYKHGESKSRLYRIWTNMKQRILNLNKDNYKYYGGRDITVCNEWLAFIPFRDWALNNGYNDTLEIDRKDTDGNYEPSNCQWITHKENSRKRRSSKLTLELANKIRYLDSTRGYTQKELAEKFCVSEREIQFIVDNKQWI